MAMAMAMHRPRPVILGIFCFLLAGLLSGTADWHSGSSALDKPIDGLEQSRPSNKDQQMTQNEQPIYTESALVTGPDVRDPRGND
ncbi:hypothetical protein N7539_009115 [Penicillium diatomitis]|uniref:Uncharacterized protein n=1 Tax=Penicillium diatomitis TaxID=2819901 RepID=A0A9W9WLA7_9EURO|nr:uncharacterized protein N7539_009115 [Penicillium diatomitis]KAJ5469497.1 hypothetical protein N7539_009115 [Penicillium diatomitis]